MDQEERQFLQTAAWLFSRHGQRNRARAVCEALAEEDRRDGTAAAALAELLLDDGEAARALEVLRGAEFPRQLEHAQAVMETRALRLLGREREAMDRWRRYMEARKGGARQWVA